IYNVLNITMDAAEEMLRNTKKRAAPTALRELGNHPDDQGAVGIFEGKYGPYVKHGKVNATIPKDTDISTVTLEQAVDWLAARAGKTGKSAKKSSKKTVRSAKSVKASGTDGEESVAEKSAAGGKKKSPAKKKTTKKKT
ncbi:MAG: topoisomerase C-terminal repeat-containing protein, partial [Planctomyces sp.]